MIQSFGILTEITRGKTRRKTQDMLLEKFGEIYSENFCNKRKATRLGGVGGGVQRPGAGPTRGQRGAAAEGRPCLLDRLVLRSVSEFS